MRKIVALVIAVVATLLIASFSTQNALAHNSASNQSAVTTSVTDSTAATQQVAVVEEAEHSNHDNSNLTPILFIILTIFIGLIARSFKDKNPLPYSITLLICGLFLGILARTNVLSFIGLDVFANAITKAGNINPHLILYLFLPTLIFEAAYALHLHTFKKMLPNVLILAIPGVIVAIAITALIVMAITGTNIGLNGWGWPMALLFGAIISATDPVAVVAILKEVGASKKLSTITESESMLNDGTAIVFFMALFAMVLGDGGGDSNAVWEFFRVSLGGVLVGAVIGWLVVLWLKHVFNDTLIEITLVIGAAYLSFFLAEYFIGVSGVLSVVTFGLMMAGPGKTRINPRNTQFLHKFWELAAFFANTVIFVIVGVIIAQQISFTGRDALVLLIIFIGLHVARLGTVYLFYPIMKRIGYGLSLKDSVVLWWGGLRGAVGLSLALIVAIEHRIPIEIRSQVLFLTAGIVVLTSLINATTIRWLLNKLGLSKTGTIKTHLMHQSMKQIRLSGEKEIEKLKESRFMGEADWKRVSDFLVDPNKIVDTTKNLKAEDTLEESRKRLLQKEKESYWRQFSQGLLSSDGVTVLSDQIETLVDYSGQISLSARQDIETLWQTPRSMSILYKLPFVGKYWRKSFFNRLALSFDCARAFVTAQEENLKSLSGLLITLSAENPDADTAFIMQLEDELNENKITGLTFLRNMKDTYPDICRAIETQLASRSLLNQQQETVERLKRQGRLEPDECIRIETLLYSDMKRLLDAPLKVDFKSEVDAAFCKSIAFSKLQDSQKQVVVNAMHELVFPDQTRISKEDTTFDGIYFIVNGSARVEKDGKLICIIEQGDMLGAYEYYLKSDNMFTLVSESPISLLRIDPETIDELKEQLPGFDQVVLHASAIEISMYILRQTKPYSEYSSKKIRSLLNESLLIELDGEDKEFLNGSVCVLVSGEATVDDSEYNLKAPALLPDCNVRSNGRSMVLLLP